MRVGSLRTPFILQEAFRAADGSTAWQTLGAIWGDIDVAAEVTPADLKRRTTHHIAVRFDPDREILTGHRLVWGSRAFLVRAVSNLREENKWLKLFVEEATYLTE